MATFSFKTIFTLSLAVLSFTACQDDDDPAPTGNLSTTRRIPTTRPNMAGQVKNEPARVARQTSAAETDKEVDASGLKPRLSTPAAGSTRDALCLGMADLNGTLTGWALSKIQLEADGKVRTGYAENKDDRDDDWDGIPNSNDTDDDNDGLPDDRDTDDDNDGIADTRETDGDSDDDGIDDNDDLDDDNDGKADWDDDADDDNDWDDDGIQNENEDNDNDGIANKDDDDDDNDGIKDTEEDDYVRPELIQLVKQYAKSLEFSLFLAANGEYAVYQPYERTDGWDWGYWYLGSANGTHYLALDMGDDDDERSFTIRSISADKLELVWFEPNSKARFVLVFRKITL